LGTGNPPDGSDRRRIASDQRHGARMLLDGLPQGREVLPLAVAAEDDREPATQALNGRQRGTDVGPFESSK
jgi:hypothetical protein